MSVLKAVYRQAYVKRGHSDASSYKSSTASFKMYYVQVGPKKVSHYQMIVRIGVCYLLLALYFLTTPILTT